MIWPVFIVATVTSLLVAIACFALGAKSTIVRGAPRYFRPSAQRSARW